MEIIIMVIRAAIAFPNFELSTNGNEFWGQQDNCGYNYSMYYYL
jgi:hypothetical protein